jgi:hypothetical protein
MTRKREKRKQEPKQEYDNSLRLMLAYLCVATEAESSLVRKVEILDKFDLSDAEIARVCGRSIGSVRNARLTVKRHHAP